MSNGVDYKQGMDEFANINPEALEKLFSASASTPDPAWQYQSSQTDDQGYSSPGYFVNVNTGDRRDAPSIEGKSQFDRLSEVDVNNVAIHKNPNFEGTPTEFYDPEGNLKGFLTDTYRWGGRGQRVVDPNNFNLALGEGEKPSLNSYVQAVNEQNQLMYVDPTTGENTIYNTGIPAKTHQLKDLLYLQDPGPRSRIAQDLKGLAYVMTAALGGAAAGGAFGGAGLGPVATAYPVTGGALLPGAELAAPALGVAGGDIGAFTAADAAASAIGGSGGLTPEAATALLEGMTSEQAANFMQYGLLPAEMQVPAAGAGLAGLTGTEALKYAKLAGGVASALGGGGGSGGGSPAAGGNYGSYGTGGGGALPGSLASTSLPGSQITQLDPFKDYNKYQQIQAIQNEQAMQHIPVAEPLYAASGGDVTSLAQIQERLSQLDPRLNSVLQNKLKANYYTYGSDSSGALPTQLMNSQLGSKPNPGYPAQAASSARTPLYDTYGFKPASLNAQEKAPETVYAKDGGHIPEFITGATGHYVKGRGDGQSDSIPAMLADGEYVFDAETVAQLGNGSSDAGAKILDRMRENIRAHKRSAPVDKIPPKSKSPLEYMAESKRK
jgi:hypothetical protein